MAISQVPPRAPSSASPPPAPAPGRRRPWRWLAAAASLLVLAVVVFLAVAFAWSGVSLAPDGTALARIKLDPFAGTLQRVRATDRHGHRIPLTLSGGRIVPRGSLTPGERIAVEVVIKRPGWLGWLRGSERRETLALRAPAARLKDRFVTVRSGAPLRVRFDQPVHAVAYGPSGGELERHTVSPPRRVVSLGSQPAAGTLQVAAAPRSWERLGSARHVTWFPAGSGPAVLASPAAGGKTTPAGPLKLTFSRSVKSVLGSERPTLSPDTAGHWSRQGSHTLVFTPSGYGAALGSKLTLTLPHSIGVVQSDGSIEQSSQIDWTVPDGSTLRLQQLLALAGYLPVSWKPADDPVARTPRAQVAAAVDPPEGSFDWRYPNTPPELQSQWSAGEANTITRGAVMMFQDRHELTVDGVAGPDVWHALIADAIAGKRNTDGYSYVYVHEAVPQKLTLWHNGSVVLTSPGNTGIPEAPTALGTYPVFEHIAEGTMSGTNPDGSHYNDPGVKWISYFNGGDALHAFPRASFGTPQSLGCVELPLAAAAKVWPYTPIGTLVTIEQ